LQKDTINDYLISDGNAAKGGLV